MIYNVKDKVPFKQLLFFAFQMVMSVFVATTLIASICGRPSNAGLVGAGVATICYLLITKFQSPMFLSNSGAFVAPVITALALSGTTGVIIGGIVTAIIYCLFGIIFSKIPVEQIYKVFPKSLIGVITAVIGINLMSFIPTYVQIDGTINSWGILVAFITMASIALISHYAKGMWKILPFLGGTLIGYLVAVCLTLSGACSMVNFNANIGGWFATPDFAFVSMVHIPIEHTISIVILYTAYTISAIMECLSDHAALGNIIGTDLYQTPGLSRIFIGEGLANIFGSMLGGLGICSYGESVACIGFSKVASAFVTLTAALMLILLGFLTPVQAFIASIPSCVFAGAAMILYGYIACSGIKMLQGVDLNNQKNLIIVATVLSIGCCGLVVGGATLSFSGTALALIVGVILNQILKEKD